LPETAKSTPQRRSQRLAEGDSASRGTAIGREQRSALNASTGVVTSWYPGKTALPLAPSFLETMESAQKRFFRNAVVKLKLVVRRFLKSRETQ